MHCKNIRISADILWRIFHILTGPVPYRFVSVNRRNNEACAHIALENWPQNIRGYIRIFLQCSLLCSTCRVCT